MAAARALSAAALFVVVALMGCHRRHAIDVGVVHHNPRSAVNVELRDGTVVSRVAVPRGDGQAWLLAIGTIPDHAIVSATRGARLQGTKEAREATVTMRDGSTVPTLALRQASGGVGHVRVRVVPNDEVVGVEHFSRARGVVMGSMGGLVLGGLLGALAGGATYEQPDCARPRSDGDTLCVDFGSEAHVGGGVMAGAVIGALVGAAVGSGGSRAAYGEVPEKGRLTVIPTPGGGVVGLSGGF